MKTKLLILCFLSMCVNKMFSQSFFTESYSNNLDIYCFTVFCRLFAFISLFFQLILATYFFSWSVYFYLKKCKKQIFFRIFAT